MHDTVIVKESRELKITFVPDISIKQSTVHKAVALFEKKLKKNIRAEIVIKKEIPQKSGLGGGSSDAATVLLLLNKMYGNPLSLNEILSLAAKIGADVPFFIYGKRAKVEGIGEIVTPLKSSILYGLIIFPEFKFSTENAYSLADKIGNWDKGTYTERLIKALELNEDIGNYLYNYFEKVYRKFNPEFTDFFNKIRLLSGKQFHLTGSGSALFYIAKDGEITEELYQKLTKEGFHIKKIKTVV